MNWFDKLLPKINSDTRLTRRGVPEGLWRKCDTCQAVLYGDDLIRSLHVCPKCDHHMRIGARERLTALFDDGRFDEIGTGILPLDVLKFRDTKRYRDRLYEAGKNTAETEALLVGAGTLEGRPLVSAAFEFRYMGGSMGSVVGERFVRATDAAIERHTPLVCFAASGGARMQEGLFSLMQMAKTSAALTDLAAARLPFISVLTDPTMGGVSASLAMLGDVIIAEPDALVGFAGQRVIEQTVREKLPEGFQRAEFLLEHGAIDMIVDRRQLRERLHSLLGLLMATDPVAVEPVPPAADLPAEPQAAEPASESDA